MDEVIHGGETLDDLRLSGMKIMQPGRGYRFSLDSILLANYVNLKKRACVADLGTGSGVISLILAARFRGAAITALEVQAELVELASRNVAMNRLEDRIEVLQMDWRRARRHLRVGGFDTVVCNPPFRSKGTGRLNPTDQKAIARHEIKGDLGDLLSAAAYLLKSRGHFYMIHLPDRLPEILPLMSRRRLSIKRMRLVHPRLDEEARHVLIHAVKDAAVSCRVAPPLFIYNPDGSYTNEAKVILAEV